LLLFAVLFAFSSLSVAPAPRWWRRPVLFVSLSVRVGLYWLLVPELYVPDVALWGDVFEVLLEL
jgi:hypothetical protein